MSPHVEAPRGSAFSLTKASHLPPPKIEDLPAIHSLLSQQVGLADEVDTKISALESKLGIYLNEQSDSCHSTPTASSDPCPLARFLTDHIAALVLIRNRLENLMESVRM